MDVVGVYTSWAQTKKISDAALWKGSGNCVSLKEKQNKFAAGLAHVRVAEWAVTGQEVALIEAQDHATTHFKVVEGPRHYAYLDAIAPASNAPKIVWQVPVCAAATGINVAVQMRRSSCGKCPYVRRPQETRWRRPRWVHVAVQMRRSSCGKCPYVRRPQESRWRRPRWVHEANAETFRLTASSAVSCALPRGGSWIVWRARRCAASRVT